jgi:hypothetical protein
MKREGYEFDYNYSWNNWGTKFWYDFYNKKCSLRQKRLFLIGTYRLYCKLVHLLTRYIRIHFSCLILTKSLAIDKFYVWMFLSWAGLLRLCALSTKGLTSTWSDDEQLHSFAEKARLFEVLDHCFQIVKFLASLEIQFNGFFLYLHNLGLIYFFLFFYGRFFLGSNFLFDMRISALSIFAWISLKESTNFFCVGFIFLHVNTIIDTFY